METEKNGVSQVDIHPLNTEKPFSSKPSANRFYSNFFIILVLAVMALVAVGGYILISFQNNTNQILEQTTYQTTQQTLIITSAPIEPSSVQPTKTPTSFQNLLYKSCLNQNHEVGLSGKIDLQKLPIDLNLADLKAREGKCDSFFGKRVDIYDGDLAIYIFDKQSDFCCSGFSPNLLRPEYEEGKLIYLKGEISIYLRANIDLGHGPVPGYAPISIHGAKDLKLDNGESIHIVISRTAIAKDDIELKKVEDIYMVVADDSSELEAGTKYFATDDSLDKLLEDKFFANFMNSDPFKKMESDLQNISLKN